MNGDLYSILLHVHSIGRWLVLILLVIAIFNSLIAGTRPYIKSDARTGLMLTIVSDIMLLVGLVLYVWGPKGYQMMDAAGGMGAAMKNPVTRFYGVEHILAMVIAIALIHIGKAQGKKHITDKAKHRRTVIFYTIALLVILISIPWPFREIAGGWF